MKQKKTLKIWQFIVSECLLVLMLVTMFLPLFNISGSSIANGAKKALKSAGALGELAGAAAGDQFDSIADEIDQTIEDYEKERNVKISKISPFNIMTKGYVKLFLGEETANDESAMEDLKSDDTVSAAMRGYTVGRVVFWVIYVVILLAAVLNLVAFCAKLAKMIPLLFETVIGVLSLAFFGYMRFGLIGSLVKSASGLAGGLGSMVGLGSAVSDDAVQGMLSKVLGSLFGVPFMILMLGGAFLLVVTSILFMFIGQPSAANQSSFAGSVPEPAYNPAPAPAPMVSPEPTPVVNPAPAPAVNPTPVVNPAPAPAPVVNPAPAPAVNPAPAPAQAARPAQAASAQQAMGQVRVVKGVATGQGFALPQDKKVIVGKNPQKSNLVIADPHVSNIHCSIRYIAATNRYIIKDHSSNGTFVNGVRLQKDTAMEYPAGTLLCLADGSNEILLG